MKRLTDHKYSNCYVETIENGVCFVSYNTPVIFLTHDKGRRKLECTGTYSQTTRKQIGYFLKEYAPDLCYYDMKKIVGRGAVAM